MIRTIGVLAAALFLTLPGCGSSYYKVTDPTTGKIYYTKHLKERSSGSATLTDAKTGNTISLQNSEVQKITEEEFNHGRYGSDEAAKAK